MTTFSSSRTPADAGIPLIPAEPPAPPPSVTTAAATGGGSDRTVLTTTRPVDTGHHPYDPVATIDLLDPPDPARPPGPLASGRPYGDPVGDLVRTAVADRPLEEVVDLITALERSPEHTRSVIDALRAAGVDRSVEDVTRLVALLTRPPRDAASADETIRAAAAHRSVDDVTLLVELLHSEPLAPHCREEVLRAAAIGRTVDELVELIDRLATQRPLTEPPRTVAADAGVSRPVRSVVRSSRLAAVALAVCGLTHFPLRHDGVSLGLHASAVGLSVLCTLLALLLVVRPGAMILAGAVAVSAFLTTAHAYTSSLPSSPLATSMDLALAPPWLAVASAAAATALSLAALVIRLSSPLPIRRLQIPTA